METKSHINMYNNIMMKQQMNHSINSLINIKNIFCSYNLKVKMSLSAFSMLFFFKKWLNSRELIWWNEQDKKQNKTCLTHLLTELQNQDITSHIMFPFFDNVELIFKTT